MVLVGMACSAYQFMIRPANKNLAEQKAKLQAKAAKLAEFEKATAAAQGLNKQLEQLREAIDFFESKLPPTSEIDKVLHDVTVIMEEKGLRSKRVLRLKEKNNSGYIEQPLKMELVGNFNSFYSFLLELEKLPRIMKIRELEVKKHIKEEGRITTDFIVSIFFQSKVG
jgi:type IV pilus assembly protein PilO